MQEELIRVKRANSAAPDELWLLEHEPVYTIGRTPDRSSLRGAKHLPHPLFEINRGGQATYHGPGQLVGYFLIDLRRHGQDLHRYLRWIEALLIELLAHYEIKARTRTGLTGVWIGNRKIASIGVGVRHWITMHGFALNVGGDLAPFDQITPCGIANVTMTSIERESGANSVVRRSGGPDGAVGENADGGSSGEYAFPDRFPLDTNARCLLVRSWRSHWKTILPTSLARRSVGWEFPTASSRRNRAQASMPSGNCTTENSTARPATGSDPSWNSTPPPWPGWRRENSILKKCKSRGWSSSTRRITTCRSTPISSGIRRAKRPSRSIAARIAPACSITRRAMA